MTERSRHVPCVGAIVHDTDGRLLLVKRADEPGAGLWSVPGGRVEAGETDAEALVRELAEETGLVCEPGPLVGRVLRGNYAIADYSARAVGGTLRAGDDAADARWVDAAEFAALPLVDELAETLGGWGVLPRQT